jgi:hypothetical protein
VSIAIMIEGLFMAALSATFVDVYDTMIYSPSGRIFYEHVRFPPRTRAAVALVASGASLFFIGFFLLF